VTSAAYFYSYFGQKDYNSALYNSALELIEELRHLSVVSREKELQATSSPKQTTG